MKNLLWKNLRDYQYLFLDMNAYFANCEQQAHPKLRGKPVAVTPTLCPTGCIVTSSYEARSFGVKTGMMIKDAKKLCPSLICRQSDTYLYLQYHQRMIGIIRNLTPFFIVKSVDELVIKLSPYDQNQTNAVKLAKTIKQTFANILGRYLTCSIGIAPNSYLSKTAAESKKPDGLTLLKSNQIKALMAKLKLTDLCGINFRMQIRLNALGIYTPLDFFDADIETLKQKMGKAGEYWYLNLHGHDIIHERERFVPKTVGQSHVLEPKLRSWRLAWPVCQKLIYKAASRMRAYQLSAKKISLYVRFYGEGRFHRWIKIPQSTDSFSLANYFKYIWKEIPQYNNFPLKIAVTLFDLLPTGYFQQRLLFPNTKQKNLSRSIDKINAGYGKNKVRPANFLLVENSAPDRISFGNPNL